MNLKINIVFFILVVFGSILNGCTHTSPNTQKPPVNSQPQRSDHQTAQTKYPEQKGVSIETSPTQIAAVEQDMLDRIRRGFKFSEYHSREVDTYIKWSINHPNYLTDLLTRAEPFLYYILEQLDKRSLPTELALLPVIESNYKPHATSSSGAAGLWQFVPTTGRHFHLEQSKWYDERRDFIKSTNAALDYLTQLNKSFNGDWQLALAAYNAGQGTINRAIKTNRRKHLSTAFKDLALRSETRRYIPKLQAIKNIIRNPSAYNVRLKQLPSQPYFTKVELPPRVDLIDFAKAAKIEPADLMHLNAGYIGNQTLSNRINEILVPITKYSSVEITLQSLSTLKNRALNMQQYRVAKGDNLSKIANRHGVTINEIKQTNQLRSSAIKTGMVLNIPTQKHAFNSATQTPKSNKKIVHKVKSGDTLWSIAKRYKVQLKQLLTWNNLSRKQTLKLNQRLFIFP